jgi:alpha-glucosidase (family GH31 glycosyl hydrolase)
LEGMACFVYIGASTSSPYLSLAWHMARPLQYASIVMHCTRMNAAEMFVDVEKAAAGPIAGTSSQWVVESGALDLYLFGGPRPSDVTRQYGALTGTTALPQLFALGYHQVGGLGLGLGLG